MDLRKRRLRQDSAWQPDKPFVIAALEGQQNNVVAVNAAAASCGIAPGMALSRARVIYPDVKAEAASLAEDAKALQRLAVRALRYSPLVATCPTDGLWIDATGAAHLFGGEDAMVKGITRRLRAIGISARTAMATFRNDGKVSMFRERFIKGMLANNYERDFAERCFSQIEGFGTYGFPESHAASFAILVYASSWVKCHHPDVFLCAILNAQPLGFYAPAQLVSDARAHDVLVFPVDINASRWDCTLEPQADGTFAVRLGFRMIKGMNTEAAAKIVAARHAPYKNLDDLWSRTEISLQHLEALAEADACMSVGVDRRQALWSVRALRKPLPLFAAADKRADIWAPHVHEPSVALTPLTAGENVLQDYATISFSLRDHPLRFLRAHLSRARWQPLGSLMQAKGGDQVRIAGLVLVRQRPGSANGIVFISLEDETGLGNLVVWPSFFESHRAVVMASRMLACAGRVKREGDIIHIVVKELYDLTPWLRRIGDEDLEQTPQVANDGSAPRLKVKSRDFH